MSKPFRTATQTRRGIRGGFPEHDDFEGLPVRQWRQEAITIAPPPLSEIKEQNDRWAVELPYGLPKEFPLLPPHTQELLRAARSGRLYKRSAPDEDEVDPDGADGKGEKKDAEPATGGYVVKTWKQIPRNNEGPTISHLAKRHKNTITLASKALAPTISGPTVRRVTIRHIDAAGNPYERTVTLAEGQKVDGEIVSETIVPAPTAVNGDLTQQSTPVKRRPPPPKRKPKGPGRGRKKGKLPLPLPLPRSNPGEEGGSPEVRGESDNPDDQGNKTENEDSNVQDSEMAENSVVASDEDEAEEADEEGENDENGDEDVRTPDVDTTNRNPDQDQEMQDSEMTEVIRPSSIEEPEELLGTPSSEEDVTISKSRFPPPGLGSLAPLPGPLHLASPRIEGSPLKNVMIQSPTDPSPMASPRIASAGASFSTSSYIEMQVTSTPMVKSATTTVIAGLMAETIMGDAEQPLTEMDSAAPLEAGQASSPLDSTGANGSHRVEELPSTIDDPQATPITPTPPREQFVAPPIVEISEAPSDTTHPFQKDPPPAEIAQQEPNSVPSEPPKSPALRPAITEDEDDGLNLLGSLERELDRQEGVSNAGSSVGDQKPTPPAAVAEGDAPDQASAAPTEPETTKVESPIIKEEVGGD